MNENAKKNNEITKGIIIYAIGTFGTKLLSFLIVPLYTYYISTSDMGVFDLFLSTCGLLTPIITFQISDAAYRWMIRNERVNDCISSTYKLLIVNSLIASGIIAIVNSFWNIPYCAYFTLLLISSRLFQTTHKLLRGLKNQRLYAVISIVYALIYLVLNVVFIAVLKLGVEFLFISQIIANVLATVIVFIVEKRIRFKLFTKTDVKLIKQMLAFSIPLVPNYLNWWIMSSSDRYIIGFFLGASFNGIYAISYKFPTLLQQVLGLFNSAWQDFSVAEDERDGSYYSGVFEKLYKFSFSMIPFAVALTHIYIHVTMSKTYHDAALYVSYLYLGTIFQVFSSFFGVGYLKDKNTLQASLTSIYGAIINILVNVCLINVIGLYAASLSTFAGFFMMWYIRYIQTKKTMMVSIKWSRYLAYFSVALAVVISSQFFSMLVDCIVAIVGFLYFVILNRSVCASAFKMVGKKLKRKKA